jgi:uncharacterized protein YbaR (Trm112 family)
VHLLLTDRLTCPRCGPEFGLIVLTEEMEDRRVLQGRLGCSNCRDTFPIREGFGDLRAPPRGALHPGRAGPPREVDRTETERLVALVGVPEGPGTIVLQGAVAPHAANFAQQVHGIEVAAVDEDLSSWPETPGVSRLAARPGLPFFGRAMRGSVVDGGLGDVWIREAARVVAPLGRVVVVWAPQGTERTLSEAGLAILASEGGTVVAARA